MSWVDTASQVETLEEYLTLSESVRKERDDRSC